MFVEGLESTAHKVFVLCKTVTAGEMEMCGKMGTYRYAVCVCVGVCVCGGGGGVMVIGELQGQDFGN